MEHVFGSLSALQWTGLVLALALALAFEFVNGFHDTANAVATVIYTRSLPPWVAVIWSGLCNLAGVLTSSGAVAFGVLSLLPVELVINAGSGAGFAMVFALLISAIVWNLGTWYLGLPASSSHSLIGSIMGVGLMNSLLHSGGLLGGVNWAKAQNIGLSLLISPVVGFVCTALLFLLLKALIRKPELYVAPDPQKAPPWWIRLILWFTCTGVSFAHGSNDGQKGMGLIMLILVGIIPGLYALDLSTSPASLGQLTTMSQQAAVILEQHHAGPVPEPESAGKTLTDYLKSSGVFSPEVFPALAEKNHEIATTLAEQTSLAGVPTAQRSALRTAIYYATETIGKLDKSGKLSADERAPLAAYKKALAKTTQFIPVWVKVAVALALGLGTMIGWKRIVVTVGEKIGKSHLTYAQGASAELVAMITIELADRYGLPVSTTHVLSSGVAGAMAANKSGLQAATLRNLLLAWVLTLPVCVFLGAMFFAGGLLLVGRLFGTH
jgi:PiT family inorganic phosphate transporter